VPLDPVASCDFWQPESQVEIGPVKLLTSEWGETQYFNYVGHLVKFDLGDSMKTDRNVGATLSSALPYTIHLGIQSLFIALLLGIPAGLYAGLKQNTAADYTTMTIAMVGVSIPNFVLGPILIMIFALDLGWFRPNGWDTWKDSVLPSITLGLFYAAYIARLTRGGMLEIIRKDFIRTARAKGLSEKLVVMRHAIKGAILPVVSYLGPAFAALLTGSVVVEEIFNLPGVGKEFVRSALNRDYNMVLGTVILYSTLLVTLNLVVDILYTVIDPRVKYD
jgi:oligopeptide transport system permease protein